MHHIQISTHHRYVVVVGGGVGVVVVLILTHRYNAVRGHRTGSYNSGAEKYLSGGKQMKTHDNTHNNWNKTYTSDKDKR